MEFPFRESSCIVSANSTGEEMIRKEMYEKVQLFKRLGYSRSEITSELEMDPKTAAKYYAMDGREFKTYQREHMFRDKVLEEYEKDILEVYKMNEFQRLNVSAVYDYLEEKYGTLLGNEQTLRNYIGYLIKTDKLRLNEKIRLYTKVPELPFGRQMQLDFGQHRCRSGFKLYIFTSSSFRQAVISTSIFRTIPSEQRRLFVICLTLLIILKEYLWR